MSFGATQQVGLRERAARPSLSVREARLLVDRNARMVGSLVVAYLALLTLMGIGFGTRLTIHAIVIAIVLGVSMVLLRTGIPRRWPSIRGWIPFIVLALAYELIRGVGPSVISRVNVDGIPALERLLFGGRIATELLQTALRPLSGFDPIAAAATVVYMIHTPLPLLVGVYLWWRDRRLFHDFVAALAILSIAAFATYLIFPAAPPWWAAATGQLSDPGGHPVIAYLKPAAFAHLGASAGLDGGAVFALVFGDISPDPVAAFPSLHAAYPLLAYLFLRRIGGPTAWAMLGFTLAAWFSIVYLGDHYVIDILGGIAYVAAVWWALPRIDRRWLGRDLDPATASGDP